MAPQVEGDLGAAVGVRERLTHRLVDSGVRLERDALTHAALRLLRDEAPLASESVATEAVDSLVGLGPVEALLRDPAVSDVLVNGPNEIWVERNGVLERATETFGSHEAIHAAAERVLAPLGLRLDRSSPAVAARLPDGSRFHAIVPPVAIDGPVIAVRRFTEAVPDLAALVDAGGADQAVAKLLHDAVVSHRNLLVSGGTGSGKTTLLNVLSKEIPEGERVITVEDAAELRLAGHVVRLEARPANTEGAGEVALRELVRQALRLRPDRIILGEVRGPEALDMIQAMSTGHDGSMSTIHANGPEEALWRVETLAMSGTGSLAEVTVRRQLHAAVDLVIHTQRANGIRKVAKILEVAHGDLREVYPC